MFSPTRSSVSCFHTPPDLWISRRHRRVWIRVFTHQTSCYYTPRFVFSHTKAKKKSRFLVFIQQLANCQNSLNSILNCFNRLRREVDIVCIDRSEMSATSLGSVARSFSCMKRQFNPKPANQDDGRALRFSDALTASFSATKNDLAQVEPCFAHRGWSKQKAKVPGF